MVGISDAFGPSIVDTDLSAIIGSVETEKGTAAVNRRRKENGLNALDVFLIDLLDDVNKLVAYF